MLVPIDLTRGAIKILLSDQSLENFKPVLQVIDIRLVKTQIQNNNHERFWILLSDGSFTIEGMLANANQMNDLVRDGKLQKSSIVMLTQFSMCNLPQKGMVILIIDLGVIRDKCHLVGKPQRYPNKTDGTVPSVARATPQVQNRPSISQKIEPMTIKQIKDVKSGKSENPNWIRVRGTIISVDINSFYNPACSDCQCGIMVTDNMDGKWRCDKCDMVFDECDYQYRLQIEIQDNTDSTWVTAFEETVEEIMGISAKDLYDMKHDKQNEEKFSELVRKVYFRKFVFDLKMEEVPVDDNMWAVKLTIVKVEKVKSGTESKYPQLDEIAKFNEEDSGSICHKIEPAVNYVNTPREFVESATPTGSGGNHYTGSRFPSSGSSCNSCGGSGHK